MQYRCLECHRISQDVGDGDGEGVSDGYCAECTYARELKAGAQMADFLDSQTEPANLVAQQFERYFKLGVIWDKEWPGKLERKERGMLNILRKQAEEDVRAEDQRNERGKGENVGRS